MRKLKLEVDELRVESFATEQGETPSGTVWGNMPMKIPATDDTTTGGSGGPGWFTESPESGCGSCPCTLKWSCYGSCDYCTVVECPTQATFCC